MKKKIAAFIKKINDLRTKFKMSRKNFVLLLVVILLAGAVYFYKGLIIAATVNGQPIYHLTLIRELEKQAGKNALDSLITRTLILQEAQKQKVTATDQEIDEQLKTLEDNITKQGQNLDQLLSAQGMTQADLREQIKLQIIVEKMVKKDVSVTDAEIKDYFDKNTSSFAKDAKLDDVKAQIKSQLEQQQLSTKIQEWVSALHDKAKINYFVNF